MTRVISFALAALMTLATPVLANDLAFGKARPDPNTPVEVAANELAVNQKDGTATFSGDVVITQGEMILSAPSVLVVYKEDSQKIATLEASGGVTLVSGRDAAEAQKAQYDIDAGLVLLTGKVLLTQGQNVMTGEKITINLQAGTAQVGGRVRTTLQTGN